MFSNAYAMGAPPGGAPGGTGGFLSFLLPILLIWAIFYFLLIRPQQVKQKQHQEMISSLRKGDKVVTAGGIYGTIVNVKEDTFVLKVDDGVRIEFAKSAIAKLVKRAGESEGEAKDEE